MMERGAEPVPSSYYTAAVPFLELVQLFKYSVPPSLATASSRPGCARHLGDRRVHCLPNMQHYYRRAALFVVTSCITLSSSWQCDAAGPTLTAAAAANGTLWGCLDPLPNGHFIDVIVATLLPDPVQLLPWVWQLGLGNAHVHVYYRSNDSNVVSLGGQSYRAHAAPCICGGLQELGLPCTHMYIYVPMQTQMQMLHDTARGRAGVMRPTCTHADTDHALAS